MVILQLFAVFFVVGLVSFGGGYAMIPVIEREVTSHHWLTTQQLTDVIALAGMAPGPIATNSAIIIGYRTSGWLGACAAAAGIVLPSLLILIVVAAFLQKYHDNLWVKSAFYGLRPVVAVLIFYGAYRFASSNGLIAAISLHTAVAGLIFAAALYALFVKRMHPLYVIMLSGLLGAAIYG